MIKIPLKKAIDLLQEASAVIVDDDALVYPELSTENMGDDENEFLYLQWENEDGNTCSVKFAEGPNRDVDVAGSSLFLTDTEGDEMQLTLLKPWEITEE